MWSTRVLSSSHVQIKPNRLKLEWLQLSWLLLAPGSIFRGQGEPRGRLGSRPRFCKSSGDGLQGRVLGFAFPWGNHYFPLTGARLVGPCCLALGPLSRVLLVGPSPRIARPRSSTEGDCLDPWSQEEPELGGARRSQEESGGEEPQQPVRARRITTLSEWRGIPLKYYGL